MRKKWAVYLMAFSCLVSMNGCGKDETQKETSSENNIVTQDKVTSDDESKDETTSEGIDESTSDGKDTSKDEDTSEGEELPDIKDTILNEKTLWGNNDNLHEVSLQALEGVKYSQVHRYKNDLLLTYHTYKDNGEPDSYVIKMISLKNGETLYEQKLSAMMYEVVQVLDDHIAINDLGDGKCYLLNSKLESVGTYEIIDGIFYLDRKAEKAYIFTFDKGIKVRDLASGEETTVKEGITSLFHSKTSNYETTFTYVDKDTMLRGASVLDLNTGEIREIESLYAYEKLQVVNDVMIGKVETYEPMYVLMNGTDQKAFYENSEYTVGMNKNSGHVIFADVMGMCDSIFKAYDNQGQALSKCDISGLTLSQEVDFVWLEKYNGYLFTLQDENEQSHLMFWEMSGKKNGDNLVLEDVITETGIPKDTVLKQEIYDEAAKLSEKYSVDILIGEQCYTEFPDHRGELLLKEDEIKHALETLDYVMGQYPEGFFEQLRHDGYKKVEIQLTGTLQKDYSTDEQIYISGGFVNYSYPGKVLMALDARAVDVNDEYNTIMAGTMYHELSHIIDRRMQCKANNVVDALYSDEKWDELNPDGYEYNDSYYGTLDAKYKDYFVDAYACSNSNEDRARTMEYAMLRDAGIFASKAGLKKKLEFYCEGIRDTFDTTGWPEVLPWEEVLQDN